MLKKRIDFLVLLNIFILIGMSFLGALDSPAYEIIYVLIFTLPAVAVFVYARRRGEGGELPIKMKREDVGGFLPLIFPTVALIILLSLLTSFILGLFGKQNEVVVYETLPENIVRHALLPAILEELAFRYVPLVLFRGQHRGVCILLSSLIFAMIHANLFQIPYAFFAGVIFITLDIIYDSILPSLVLHLLNNLISVISIYYGIDWQIVVAVLLLAAVSAVSIHKNRHSYYDKLNGVISEKCEEKLSYSPIFIIIPTLLLAILNLAV